MLKWSIRYWMYLHPWTKEWAWSRHLMGKILANSIYVDGDENLLGSDRSPTFEEWKQRFNEERSNVQLSMDIIKNSYSNTNIIPNDLTNENIDCLRETFGGACCSRSLIIARGWRIEGINCEMKEHSGKSSEKSLWWLKKRVVWWLHQLMANKNYHANRIVHSFISCNDRRRTL